MNINHSLTSLDESLLMRIIAQCFTNEIIRYADYVYWYKGLWNISNKFYTSFTPDCKLMYCIMMTSPCLYRIAKLIVPLVFNRDFQAPIDDVWPISYYYNNRNFTVHNCADILKINDVSWYNFKRLDALNSCMTVHITYNHINYLIAKGLQSLKIYLDPRSDEAAWGEYLSKVAVAQLTTNIHIENLNPTVKSYKLCFSGLNQPHPKWSNLITLDITGNYTYGDYHIINLSDCVKLQTLFCKNIELRGSWSSSLINLIIDKSKVKEKLPFTLQYLGVIRANIKQSLGAHLINLKSLLLVGVNDVTFEDVSGSPLEFMMVDGVKIMK